LGEELTTVTKETLNCVLLGNLYLLFKSLLTAELTAQLQPALRASYKVKRKGISVFLHRFILAVV
jgi:hypothetical protein